MTFNCWCRWRYENCVLSSTLSFFSAAFLILGLISCVYAWLISSPNSRLGFSPPACLEDNEGSWSIGVFYGDSPFSLKPIENRNIWNDKSAAWPVANPVITCASVSRSGIPSNFVADPFLYRQGGVLYMFFESKSSITSQGDIGVAKSTDNGATWQQLGIALDEDWHLSYPYVFEFDGQIYMMPECSKKGDTRLYKAVKFPLEWTLEKVILKKPLVDSVIVPYNGKYWLFGSDYRGLYTKRYGELEIWYSTTPLGPWTPHKKNPIYNAHKSLGARNGGRPFVYNGSLYRTGQDCGETYGKRLRTFRIESLTTEDYKETEVPLNLEESKKGRNAWNGARYHHLDVQQLSSTEWIGVADGDRVPSSNMHQRYILGSVSAMFAGVLVVLIGMLLGAVKCIVPLSWCPHNIGKRSDAFLDLEQSNTLASKFRRFCSRLNRVSTFLRGRIKLKTCTGRLVLTIAAVAAVVLTCTAVGYIYGGNGAQVAYPYDDHYSQFTLLTMTYDARMWNLKMYVKHYSRCASVREIVVVWNKGVPPDLSELDSAVPVRIRVEERNSLNNRFKVDPLIKTRAVLELDDDIMMSCNDVERGFNVWRRHPDRLVGFYPRLADGKLLEYKGEKHARDHGGYNMILTGAAFMDSKLAFERYWKGEAEPAREKVDKYFNCEDVLLNYLYANASSSSRAVEYVRPAWAIDTSKLSGVAISRNTQEHYKLRSNCLVEFSEMFGSLKKQKSPFNGREDGWDL